jgi:hypothetical protein
MVAPESQAHAFHGMNLHIRSAHDATDGHHNKVPRVSVGLGHHTRRRHDGVSINGLGAWRGLSQEFAAWPMLSCRQQQRWPRSLSLTPTNLLAATFLSCSNLDAIDGDTICCGTQRKRVSAWIT